MFNENRHCSKLVKTYSTLESFDCFLAALAADGNSLASRLYIHVKEEANGGFKVVMTGYESIYCTAALLLLKPQKFSSPPIRSLLQLPYYDMFKLPHSAANQNHRHLPHSVT